MWFNLWLRWFFPSSRVVHAKWKGCEPKEICHRTSRSVRNWWQPMDLFPPALHTCYSSVEPSGKKCNHFLKLASAIVALDLWEQKLLPRFPWGVSPLRLKRSAKLVLLQCGTQMLLNSSTSWFDAWKFPPDWPSAWGWYIVFAGIDVSSMLKVVCRNSRGSYNRG